MGKTSKYPAYSSGSVQLNGRTVSTAQKVGNDVRTNYNMDNDEKEIFSNIKSGMNNTLKNFNNISDSQRTQWGEQLNALKAQGIEQLNDIYNPMQENLKNDIASRFGNFDNSVFMDNLNNIMNKKSKAIADLSNDIMSVQNNLYTQELNNRMNTISFLSGLNTDLNNNMLNYMNAASANARAGNTYNAQAYSALGRNNLNNYMNLAGSALRFGSQSF
ncbi:hypothetical protein J6G99_04525 [bacterium]|nr:hypothetical protein [bacterium]